MQRTAFSSGQVRRARHAEPRHENKSFGSLLLFDNQNQPLTHSYSPSVLGRGDAVVADDGLHDCESLQPGSRQRRLRSVLGNWITYWTDSPPLPPSATPPGSPTATHMTEPSAASSSEPVLGYLLPLEVFGYVTDEQRRQLWRAHSERDAGQHKNHFDCHTMARCGVKPGSRELSGLISGSGGDIDERRMLTSTADERRLLTLYSYYYTKRPLKGSEIQWIEANLPPDDAVGRVRFHPLVREAVIHLWIKLTTQPHVRAPTSASFVHAQLDQWSSESANLELSTLEHMLAIRLDERSFTEVYSCEAAAPFAKAEMGFIEHARLRQAAYVLLVEQLSPPDTPAAVTAVALAAARARAQEEWDADRGPLRPVHLSFLWFTALVLQFADHWVESATVAAYTDLLGRLFARLSDQPTISIPVAEPAQQSGGTIFTADDQSSLNLSGTLGAVSPYPSTLLPQSDAAPQQTCQSRTASHSLGPVPFDTASHGIHHVTGSLPSAATRVAPLEAPSEEQVRHASLLPRGLPCRPLGASRGGALPKRRRPKPLLIPSSEVKEPPVVRGQFILSPASLAETSRTQHVETRPDANEAPSKPRHRQRTHRRFEFVPVLGQSSIAPALHQCRGRIVDARPVRFQQQPEHEAAGRLAVDAQSTLDDSYQVPLRGRQSRRQPLPHDEALTSGPAAFAERPTSRLGGPRKNKSNSVHREPCYHCDQNLAPPPTPAELSDQHALQPRKPPLSAPWATATGNVGSFDDSTLFETSLGSVTAGPDVAFAAGSLTSSQGSLGKATVASVPSLTSLKSMSSSQRGNLPWRTSRTAELIRVLDVPIPHHQRRFELKRRAFNREKIVDNKLPSGVYTTSGVASSGQLLPFPAPVTRTIGAT